MAKKKKAVFMTFYDEKGKVTKEIPMTAATDDWIRAGRLRKQAEVGDKEAAKKLREMENTQLYYYEDE